MLNMITIKRNKTRKIYSAVEGGRGINAHVLFLTCEVK